MKGIRASCNKPAPLPGETGRLREWADLNRAILHNPNSDETLRLIVDRAVAWTGADAGALVRADAGGQARLAVFRGQVVPRAWGFHAPLDARLGACMAACPDFSLGDSQLAVPINGPEGMLGMLAVFRHGSEAQPFSDEEESLLPMLADQAALALQRVCQAEPEDSRKCRWAEEELQLSRARLAWVLETTGVGLWFNALPLSWLNWDEQTRRLFFVPPEAEPTIDLFWSRLHPDDREPTRLAMEAAIRDRTLYEIDHRAADPATGQVRWIRSAGQATYAPDGTPIRFDGINFDITERKRAEQEIARLNQDLRRRVTDLQTILDTAPIGLSISNDPQGRHIRSNPANERMLGLPRGSELSKAGPRPASFRVFGDGQELPTEALPMQRAIRGETVTGQVIEVERLDGEHIILYCNATPLRDEDGRPRGAVGAFLDITSLKQAETALRHTQARFRLLSETAGKLLASDDPQGLVHELCREVMAYLDCQVFFNYLADETAGRLRLNASAGISEEAAKHIAWLDYGETLCGAVARDGRTLHLEDLSRNPDPRGALARDFGIQAYCGHPLRAGDQLLGTLSFGTRTRVRFTADEIEVMRTIADQVAIAMQRIQVQRSLRESELFYRQTLESIPGMVFTTRPDGYCDFQSQQWVDYTGVPMHEQLGDGWNRLLHPDDQPRAYLAWRAAVAGQAPYDLEYRVRRHDGKYEWFKVRGRPIYNEAGRIVRWFGVAMNIEGLKRSEDALRRSEERYRGLVEQAVDGILVCDGQGRYLDVNTAGASMLGYTRQELLKLSVADVVAPDEVPRISPEIAKLGEGGVMLSEWRFHRKDGSVFPGEVMCRRLPDGPIQAILRDITERKEAEKARSLAEQRFKMEESFRSHVAIQTAAAIAHELNQPLTAIASYAEVALFLLGTGKPDPQELRYALENTEKQAQRAGQAMRQLLALLHKGETRTEPVDLKAALEDALGIIRANGELGGFVIVLDIAPDLPEVRANRLQIEKVLVNLLRNGLESMRDAGMRDGAIDLAARPVSGGEPMVRVTVLDRGKGLDAEALKSIFQPFYTSKPKGLGMGLAVSKALIEAHGGKLWAEPNAGGPGASFHFTLPLVAP